MIKNKNGITLTVVIIMVLVMLLIAGITITAGKDLLKNTEKGRLITNLYIVKARAETLLEDYLFDGTDNLGGVVDSEDISRVGWHEEEGYYIYRLWSASKLEEQGIDSKNFSSIENFIIQYDVVNDKVDVACTKGFVNENGVAVYKLSELDD